MHKVTGLIGLQVVQVMPVLRLSGKKHATQVNSLYVLQEPIQVIQVIHFLQSFLAMYFVQSMQFIQVISLKVLYKLQGHASKPVDVVEVKHVISRYESYRLYKLFRL